MITRTRLLAALEYNDVTGIFVWKETRGKAVAGCAAGWKSNRGYIRIAVDGKTYSAHRLVWLWLTGNLPEHRLDHIDGNKENNTAENLREDLFGRNSQNVRKPYANSKSQLLGAYLHQRTNKWRAFITISGKSKALGTFASAEEAHSAYIAAKRKHHSFCTI